jgi:CubicO group peptidase (beta-lactamase class C family)
MLCAIQNVTFSERDPYLSRQCIEITDKNVFMVNKIIIPLLFFFATTNLAAQNKAKLIDQLVQSYHDKQAFNGSVLVAKNGNVIFQKGYGAANREWNQPITSATRFRIASLTKQFTAMLVMQLKQMGKLSLEDPITRFLPWYNKRTGDKVTLHHLLTHTSGIPDYTSKPNFFNGIAVHRYSPKEFVENYCSDSLQFEPGTKHVYCNSNYYILGAVIESITGKAFSQVLKDQIFDVIGMENSGVDEPNAIIQNRASGYNYNYGDYTNADYIDMASTIYAAGGIYSTVADLLKWDNALYGETLLSKENKAILFTPHQNKYAYGIVVNKVHLPELKKEVTFMAHSGGINGFRSVMVREVVDRELIIILSNTIINNNYGLDLYPISNRIYSILHGLPYEHPKPSIVSALGERLKNGNAKEAILHFRSIKTKSKEKHDFSNMESELNALGYHLLGKQRIADAIAIFKLNTEEFPTSWNVFDSYAEALMNDGQNELALTYYNRSLELNPENTNAKEQMAKLRSGIK